jgi:hypothetical protein
MKTNKYQAERIQNYINNNNDSGNSNLEIIIVKQYTETLFSFMTRGGATILLSISKMGKLDDADYNIVYHITHKTEVA